MNNILISIVLCHFFFNPAIQATEKEFKPLNCEQRPGYGPKYYNCLSKQRDAVEVFEIGDPTTWKKLENPQVLDIKVGHSFDNGVNLPGALRIKTEATFKRFPNLESLFITAKNMSFPYDVVSDSNKWKRMRSNLFNINGLRLLEINGTGLNTQRHIWKLPVSLKHLKLVNQNYIKYDLGRCFDLETLDFSNNRLLEMPLLSSPLPPLRELDLSKNPLYTFTVQDVARLCNLQKLNLDYTGMGSRHRNCECFRLKEWVKYLKAETKENFVFLGTFNCDDSVNETRCRNNGYTLSDAKQLRKTCQKAYYRRRSILNAESRTIPDPGSGLTVIISAVSTMIVLIAFSVGGAHVYTNYFRQRPNSNISSPA